jgi:hypothetical protein
LNYVIELRRAGRKHPEILPVKLNECDIPDIQLDSDRNLNELHWLLLDDENWEASVRQLVEITLRMAKERAKISLRVEAEEVAVRNSRLVRAREELTTHERRIIRQQIHRQVFSQYGQKDSMDWQRFELPSVWPAQDVAKKETEYEYAWSQYSKHQVEFVQKFGEEYHPLPEFMDKMAEEIKRIHKSFEDARRDEEASIEEGLKGVTVLIVVVGLAAIALILIVGWLRSALGL